MFHKVFHRPFLCRYRPKEVVRFVLSLVITNPVNMPDPIRIRSGSGGKHWPEAGRMILAHRLASGPDPFGQNLTQN